MPASIKELTNAANVLRQAGQFDEAIDRYAAIVPLAPDNPVLVHNLAAALGDAGRHSEAIAYSDVAISMGLFAPATFLVRARALLALGRIAESASAYREALLRAPADSKIHREYAQLIWMDTGDRDRAVSALNSAIAAHPHVLDLQLVLAHIIGQSGDAAEEYEMVRRIKERHPQSMELSIAATNSSLAAGDYESALSFARQAAEAKPEEPACLQALSRALLAVGEAGEAELIISRLRLKFPNDQFLIALLATAWRILGREQYHLLYDYDRFLMSAELSRPAGWARLDDYLQDLESTLDRRHQFHCHPFGLSLRNGAQLPSIDQIDEPATRALPEALREPIAGILDRIGRGDDPLTSRNLGGARLFSIWSVRLRRAGHHVSHVHPQGWISSACHLRFPTSSGSADKQGWMKFGDPGVPTAPALTAERFVEPKRARIVFFPSYLWHGTIPFDDESSRLTFAFDLVPSEAIAI